MLVYNLVLDVMLAALWVMVWKNRRTAQENAALLQDFEHFLVELSQEYSRCADMLEALETSIPTAGGLLREELLTFLDALKGNRFDDSTLDVKQQKNPYVLLLLSLCATIRTYGDMQVNGVSLFVYNLRYIKEEVRIELLRRQEGHYAFLGLSALAFLPFFVCVPLQLWSHSISESLDRFFTGGYGFVTLSVCFLLTVVCALGVQELQYPIQPGVRNGALEQRLLAFSFVRIPIDRHIARHYSRYLRQNEQLKNLQGYGNIREFLLRKVICALACMMLAAVLLFGSFLIQMHQGDSGSMMASLLLLFFAGAFGFFLPDARVIILRARVEYQKMEETLRFETLILIVIHYTQVTVEELLRQMERFSIVFSRALQRAVDDFSFHRRESLERLGEDLCYEPAKKISDGLIACDDLPLSQVFHDIEGERAYNMESFKRKALDLQREKAAFARVIAFLPFVAILVLRLIVPFVLEGLSQLNQY